MFLLACHLRTPKELSSSVLFRPLPLSLANNYKITKQKWFFFQLKNYQFSKTTTSPKSSSFTNFSNKVPRRTFLRKRFFNTSLSLEDFCFVHSHIAQTRSIRRKSRGRIGSACLAYQLSVNNMTSWAWIRDKAEAYTAVQFVREGTKR